MNSKYFSNEKPDVDKIITFIHQSASGNGINLDKIALVGGWAKEVRKIKDANKIIGLLEVQTIIDNSSKFGGDVDLVVFVSEIDKNWKRMLSEVLNSGIPENEKNGYVDIVLSLPANVRFPGIEVFSEKA